MANETPLLRVSGLSVAYRQAGRWLEALRAVDLEIQAGQTVGLVGESGSGKTTLALAILGFMGESGRVQAGRIEFAGRDLLALRPAERERLWGREMSLVPQDPLASLNPSLRVGEQLAEGLRHHLGLGRREAHRRSLELLAMVHLPDPARVAASYPHQLSGGMQQRVLIAMALSTEPRLLVLDEPTTGLDVTTQAAVLDLVRELTAGRDTAVLYVTHNLGVVAQICDRVAVLYAGELVEEAGLHDLFCRPLHPYTRLLLDSLPRLGENKTQRRLAGIPGQVPPLGARPTGCPFVDRCPLAIEICHTHPPLYHPTATRSTRCHRWEEIAADELNNGLKVTTASPPQRGLSLSKPFKPVITITGGFAAVLRTDLNPRKSAVSPPLLELRDLHVHFRPTRLSRRPLRAVDGVDLSLAPGQTLGLVGESGSGKTSLARAVAGLQAPSAGELRLLGLPLPPRLERRPRATLRHLQMVFQNPDEALNPYQTVAAALRRPLITILGLSPHAAAAQVARLLAAVRLPPEIAHRLPAQLSGGEKQRVAIARAFAARPDLLIADEPVSSLDVSVQASILNLLADLQAAQGSALLFISHDLAVVGYLADRVAVIYAGRLMELTPAGALFTPPHHPYTEALLAAVPDPDPTAARRELRLADRHNAQPRGCPFQARCPRFLGPICAEQEPPWQTDPASAKNYLCHIPPAELAPLQARTEHP